MLPPAKEPQDEQTTASTDSVQPYQQPRKLQPKGGEKSFQQMVAPLLEQNRRNEPAKSSKRKKTRIATIK